MSKKLYEKHKKLYQVLIGIRQRCLNKNNNKYKSYGGRGIAVCNEWKDSADCFIEWSLCNGYKDGLSIDRINNDGNYEPSNCRWVNRNTQAKNTRLLYSSNTTGYRGVTLAKDGKYKAQIRVDGKRIHIAYLANIEDSAYAYDKYVIDNGLEHTTNGLYAKEQ